MDSPRRRHPPPPPLAPSSRPLDLEVTIVSAKHLKNVNWRGGDLKPYVVAYVDPDRRAATKPDGAGSTRPVWNERLVLLLPSPDAPLFLTLDVFHSKPSETPKPLVGTARSPLKDLLDPDAFAAASPVRTLELRRPSGRPQGKIRIRLAVRERPCPPPHHGPNPHFPLPPPSSAYCYSTAPPLPSPPPPPHSVRENRPFSHPPPPLPPYGHPIPVPPLPHVPPHPRPHPHTSQYPYSSYSDPYSSGYYPPSVAGYYSAPPALAAAPTRPYYDQASGYGGPSAPSGYSSGFPPYDHKPKVGRIGAGTGLAVGAVAGALGELTVEEVLKQKEEKMTERGESDFSGRDGYSDYRAYY